MDTAGRKKRREVEDWEVGLSLLSTYHLSHIEHFCHCQDLFSMVGDYWIGKCGVLVYKLRAAQTKQERQIPVSFGAVSMDSSTVDDNTSLLHRDGGYGSIINTSKHNNGFSQSEDDENIRSIHTMHRVFTAMSSRGTTAIGESIRKIRQKMAPFPASVRDMGGTSSMSNEMFNLVKNLVGAGAFAIPSGFASLAGGSMSKSVMIPAAAIILIMATIFVYYFILIGRLCRMTRAASYKEAFDTSAGRASAVWRRLTFLVPLSVILMAGLGNLAYSMILADTTRSLLARVGYEVSRTSSLMYITIFVLLPLCLVKKLSVLAPFSALGTGGIVFTLAVMALRCFDGTYDSQRDGRFLDVSVIVCAVLALDCFR